MQLRKEEKWFESKNTKVVIVTFEQRWRVQAYVKETKLTWPVLLDSDRTLYRGYEMERGSARKVMGVSNWLTYLKLMWQGQRVQRPTDDIYQLGGDVLIDPQRIIRMHFVSDKPIDRPTVESIQELITT